MYTPAEIRDLRAFAEEIRLASLEEFDSLGTGHIGGAMSIVELLAVLYGKVMHINPADPHWEDRDKLVLSKGHAGPALYATLACKGYFPYEWLMTLNQPHTDLPSHCDRNHTPGIDMTTGSLGQGVSTAMGFACAARAQKKDWYTYLIIGDGESNEGQVWEGAQFAVHQNLDNIIMFVDWNKKQLDGVTAQISGEPHLKEKFEAFGWDTQLVDGHDVEALLAAIDHAKSVHGKPSCIVMDTIKGHGCILAETKDDNHSITFTSEQMKPSIDAVKAKLTAIKAEVL